VALEADGVLFDGRRLAQPLSLGMHALGEAA
jgi:hypothetical protein